jgi:prepilin-type N-terminal cleavage/methylation domain-containing protein
MQQTRHISMAVQGPRRTPGFSLIELVLVLTIISILSAIAVPRYAGALARYRADAASRRVMADLAYARQYARSTSTSVSVEFKIATNEIKLSGIPGQDGTPGDWRTELNSRPYLADLVVADLGGDAVVVFDGYGDPDTGGMAILIVGSEVRMVILDSDTGKAVVQ